MHMQLQLQQPFEPRAARSLAPLGEPPPGQAPAVPPGQPAAAGPAAPRPRTGALRTAIARRQFQLAYQPIVTLTDRAAHHYEALLRPAPLDDGRTLTPQQFVTAAEAAGLAEALDLAVLSQALAAAQGAAAAPIAVNISGLSLQSIRFRASVLRLLDSAALPPGRLLIEFTETAEIADAATASATLAALRGAGVLVCLDDLGAGAAAFRYLRDFGVDFVKIDGAYVRAAARRERDARLVAAMVDLAHALGASVIAEMIETEAEAAAMLRLGVDFGQGWLFGRPAPLPLPA